MNYNFNLALSTLFIIYLSLVPCRSKITFQYLSGDDILTSSSPILVINNKTSLPTSTTRPSNTTTADLKPLGPFDRVRGPDCKTPFVTFDVRPICGSDGKTYSNVSAFRNAQCDDVNLEFVHWGVCNDSKFEFVSGHEVFKYKRPYLPQDLKFPNTTTSTTTTTTVPIVPRINETTPITPDTEIATEVPTLASFNRVRGPDCKTPFVTLEYNPICGSDGKTYPNVSTFRNAQCDDANLEFIHWGECPVEKSSPKENEVSVERAPLGPFDRIRGPDCKTPFVTLEYNPICGSDGKTYPNVSTFRNAQCDDENLGFIHWGECPTEKISSRESEVPVERASLGPFDRVRGPDCKTPFVTLEYDPICGSDGKTYPNISTFRNAQCDDANLEFIHWGECPVKEPSPSPRKEEVPLERPPLGPFDRIRGPDCKTPFITLEYDPICGTDGKTYPNVSTFRNAQCDEENLGFSHWGECPIKEPSPSPRKEEVPLERPPLGPFDRVRGPDCKTAFSTFEYNPICGSDGKTYPNVSLFRNAQCDDEDLEFSHWGECPVEEPSLREEEIPFEGAPLGPFDRVRGPDCKTSYITREYNPICGSDGKTYPNVSTFRNAQCDDENLEFSHWGECIVKPKEECVPKRPPLGPFDRIRGIDCKTPFVTLEYNPLCGSDGKTYPNVSTFRNAQCDDEELEFLHWGDCTVDERSFNRDCMGEKQPLGPFNRTRGPNCKVECPKYHDPICSSSGTIYANECYFRNAQCDDEKLKFLHWGLCNSNDADRIPAIIFVEESGPFETSPLEPFNRVRGPDCRTFATTEYHPICGTDGRTYKNVSTFRNAQCDNKNLGFRYWGSCFEGWSEYFGNMLPLGPFDRVRGPDCETPCTKEYNPVCGTDGKTYSNPCVFRNAQCKDVNLEFKHYGKCIDTPVKSIRTRDDVSTPFNRVRGPGCVTPCTKEYNPVCGNNGKTYSNPCVFRNAQCDDVTLEFLHMGKCETKVESPIEEIDSEFYKYNYKLTRVRGPNCKKPCSSLYSPMYGSDGKKYDNLCHLLNAMCDDPTLKHSMATVYDSELSVPEPEKRSDLGPFNRTRGPDCKIECSKYYDPICSSSGTIYANECYFRNAQCDDKKLKFLHWGKCDHNDADKIPAIIFTKDSGPFEALPLGPFDRVRGPGCKTPFITKDLRYICGSDGVTYTNVPLFRNAQCDDESLEFVHWGPCKTGKNKESIRDQIVFHPDLNEPLPGPLERKRGPGCKTACTRELRIICGNDGVSHSNPCEFKNAQCDNVGLLALHWGPCNDSDAEFITTTTTTTTATVSVNEEEDPVDISSDVSTSTPSCSTRPEDTSEDIKRDSDSKTNLRRFKEEEPISPTTTTTTVTFEETTTDDFISLMQVLNATKYQTPFPTITRESVGHCLNPGDLKLIFGEATSEQFQNAVIVCGRSSLGNGNKTAKCIQQRLFGPENLKISDSCVSCYGASATCGSKKCKSACLTSTCNTKCQKCYEQHCSKALKECVGTSWVPRPCGLGPFEEIPSGWKVPDPKI